MVTIEQVVASIQEQLTPVERLLELFLPKAFLSAADTLLFQDGICRPVAIADTEVCVVIGAQGGFCGVASVENGVLVPRKVVRAVLGQN